ncbi:T-complex 10 C-terminal domain-containing protein [Nocardia sp. CDC159]|uniref:T-complex 10 C-terminal domain-containing protein n=1 Tax=Nocardia pulmonis TaxID=2951408 RepID=A0A9X2IUD6_9NOCA|nr:MULTISPECIES: T-complex 10 C-terminal domain-containing protein [Nocardia]MCM6772762.1 T-complex 10 C-terminal domain-containing protein [Nocardia pulmonis]MCM6785935.1 T-complex 10 C-terminal domain-containing protein [Nocardia sp. CDC159]
MSPGRPTLKISEVEKWNPDVLGTDATHFDTVVTKGDQLLQSMVTKQHELAESWKGAGADSAAARVEAEKTAGSHLMGKIGGLKTALSTHQGELAHAKQFVIDRRNLIVGMGFEVADDGTVTSVAKQQALKAAAGRNPHSDPGYLAKALLDVEYEAAQQQLAMVTALQNADNTATAAKAAIDMAKSELARVALYEMPPKGIRAMFPGLLHPDSAQPNELPPILGDALKLEQGIPLTVTNPDGSTKTVTPNPDGTLTVASSVQQPDGSTITTETTGHNPPVTTVTKPRPDGSGIVDMTVTSADGKQQQLQKVPEGNGKTSTYAANADGSRGAKVSESYPQNGGTVTDKYGANGVIDRQWQRPDGFRAFEQYVPGPDGKLHLAGTANSAGMQSQMQPDGTVKTTYPDGKAASTAQLADGRIVTKFPDGSVLQYDPSQAPPSTPKQSIWDNVKSFTGTEWNSLYGSTKDTVVTHPLATGFSGATAAGAEWAKAGGASMAGQAGAAMAESHINQVRALQMLDSGTPGAGHTFAGALDSATDAASKAEIGQLLKTDGKALGGIPLGAAVNAYVNWDDWAHHGKPGDEAIANAAGGTVGGWAGAAAGASLGAAVCSPFPIIGQAFCAGIGAGLLGFGGGSIGAWTAEQPFK